jgi:thioesterase domain-containing protein
LRAAGEEVRFLALLDAPARGRGRLVRSIQKIVETLRHARAALRRSAAIEQTQVGAQATRPHSASEDAASLPNRLRVHDASRRALDAYQPRPYPGSLILFRAAIAPSWPKRLLGDSTLLWRRLAQGAVTERLVPANHFDFFADGPINVLADQFCECMEAATVR